MESDSATEGRRGLSRHNVCEFLMETFSLSSYFMSKYNPLCVCMCVSTYYKIIPNSYLNSWIHDLQLVLFQVQILEREHAALEKLGASL